MKGNISPGDKIFKIGSKTLSDEAELTFSGKEIRKVKLNCKISIKNNEPISVFIKPDREYEHYKNVSITLNSDIIPTKAINQPISKEKIITQFSKTTDTPFEFSKIEIYLDEGLYIPKISEINALRREALKKLEELVCLKFTRVPIKINQRMFKNKPHSSIKTSLCLMEINSSFDYSKLEDIDRVYIPLKFFEHIKYKKCISAINSKFDTYIYLPTILTSNYYNLIWNTINSALAEYNISGFVFSNISSIIKMKETEYKNYDFIANYTLNIFNNYSAYELSRTGVDTLTLSPELNKFDVQNIISNIDKELIVYGRLKVMSSRYCLLGHSNICYPTCDSKCRENNKYYLKDRMGFLFRVIPDNFQTVTNIYNSKILSISPTDLNIDYARINILDENIEEINHIISVVKSGSRLEGQDYTNGHMNRNV